MQSHTISQGQEKTYVLIFDTGDEVMAGLQEFSRQYGISAAGLTGIGAFSSATLGYYDIDRKEYDKIPVDEQVEVLSLVGDVSLEKNEPKVHVHVVVGRRDGAALGGHVLEARVRPTLEIILTESPAHLRRRYDEASGLALIDLSHTKGGE